MSDQDTGAPSTAPSGSAAFTERELAMLGWAMQSLKTGPPEIDYEKLAGFAGMSNPRSASNAWAKIKTKLIVPNPDGTSPAPAPKKAATPRKKAAPKEAKEGEDGETPKKTPRKRAPKKQEVDGADSSPKKKGRPAKKEEAVKTETDDSETTKSAGTPAPVKDEAVEENIEDEV